MLCSQKFSFIASESCEPPAQKTKKPKCCISLTYSALVESKLVSYPNISVHDLQSLVRDAADDSGEVTHSSQTVKRPWDTSELQSLRSRRRACVDRAERRVLSKQIWKKTRQALRTWQTLRLRHQLEQFSDLKQLERIAAEPVQRKAVSVLRPTADAFANTWGHVYFSFAPALALQDISVLASLEDLQLVELQLAFKQLRKGKCADRHNVLLEMLFHGGYHLHATMLDLFNNILHTGLLPSTWREIEFIMLPKGDDLSDVNNWRPIAILDVAYKVCAKMLYNRIFPLMNDYQCGEQMGFQPSCGTDDALLLLECVVGASIEWQLPCWMVSIDLSKAFDK